MSEKGTCKKCGAAVLWVNTLNQKRIPLDHSEFPDRKYVLDAGSDPMVAKLRNVYACHFDTCRKKDKPMPEGSPE